MKQFHLLPICRTFLRRIIFLSLLQSFPNTPHNYFLKPLRGRRHNLFKMRDYVSWLFILIQCELFLRAVNYKCNLCKKKNVYVRIMLQDGNARFTARDGIKMEPSMRHTGHRSSTLFSSCFFQCAESEGHRGEVCDERPSPPCFLQSMGGSQNDFYSYVTVTLTFKWTFL